MIKLYLLLILKCIISVHISYASSQEDTESIEVLYSPESLQEGLGSDFKLLEQFNEARKSVSRKTKSDQYNIPLLPNDLSTLNEFDSLSDEQAEKFLANKQLFLERISSTFIWLKMPIKLHNKIIASFNDQFFKGVGPISKSNATGVQIRIQFATGIGFNDYLVKKIRETRLGRFIPEKHGFYLGLSFGLEILKVISEDNKPKLILNFFSEYNKLEKVQSFLAIGYVDAIISYVAEIHNTSGQRSKTVFGNFIGPIGTIRTNFDHFSFGPGITASLPPFVDNATFFTFKEIRWLNYKMELDFANSIIKRFYPEKRSIHYLLCHQVFN